jgi:hypothetical protein
MAKAKKQTLYAYLDGSDHEPVIEVIEPRLDALVEGRKWKAPDVWVVNQREPAAWDLGINLALPAAEKARTACFDDITAIVELFSALHRETKRTFVIGIADDASGTTKDLFFVRDGAPDLEELRRAVTGDGPR